jgi:hypothetical protein
MLPHIFDPPDVQRRDHGRGNWLGYLMYSRFAYAGRPTWARVKWGRHR